MESMTATPPGDGGSSTRTTLRLPSERLLSLASTLTGGMHSAPAAQRYKSSRAIGAFSGGTTCGRVRKQRVKFQSRHAAHCIQLASYLFKACLEQQAVHSAVATHDRDVSGAVLLRHRVLHDVAQLNVACGGEASIIVSIHGVRGNRVTSSSTRE